MNYICTCLFRSYAENRQTNRFDACCRACNKWITHHVIPSITHRVNKKEHRFDWQAVASRRLPVKRVSGLNKLPPDVPVFHDEHRAQPCIIGYMIAPNSITRFCFAIELLPGGAGGRAACAPRGSAKTSTTSAAKRPLALGDVCPARGRESRFLGCPSWLIMAIRFSVDKYSVRDIFITCPPRL
jgi:hypothetical protein